MSEFDTTFNQWYTTVVGSLLPPDLPWEIAKKDIRSLLDATDYFHLAELLETIGFHEYGTNPGDRVHRIGDKLQKYITSLEELRRFVESNADDDWRIYETKHRPHYMFSWPSGAGGDWLVHILSLHAREQLGFEYTEPDIPESGVYTNKWHPGKIGFVEHMDYNYEEVLVEQTGSPHVWMKNHEVDQRLNKFLMQFTQCRVVQIRPLTNQGRWECVKRYTFKLMHENTEPTGFHNLMREYTKHGRDAVIDILPDPEEFPRTYRDEWLNQIGRRKIHDYWPMIYRWNQDALGLVNDEYEAYHKQLKTVHPILTVSFESLMLSGIASMAQEIQRVVQFVGMVPDDNIIRYHCNQYIDQHRFLQNTIPLGK